MSRLRVAPIVEGHGEVQSVRIVLERIWYELAAGEFIDVLQPVRQPRSKLLVSNRNTGKNAPNEHELRRALQLAQNKLLQASERSCATFILIMLDANSDCPAELGPAILETARNIVPGMDVVVVLPKVEFETWFVAAADSLEDDLLVSSDTPPPADPEKQHCGKKWIKEHFRKRRYSETADQPALSAKMDLRLCRNRSASFNRLCRELEKRARQ